MALKRKRLTDQLDSNESSSEERISINADEDLGAFATYSGPKSAPDAWSLDAFAPYKPAIGSTDSEVAFAPPLDLSIDSTPTIDTAPHLQDVAQSRISLDGASSLNSFEDPGFSNGLLGLHAQPVADREEAEAKISKPRKGKDTPLELKPEEMFDVSAFATDWSKLAETDAAVSDAPADAPGPVAGFVDDVTSSAGMSVPTTPGRFFVRLGKFSATYDLDLPEMLIGRPDPDNDALPEITIEWDDAISRKHARVFRKGNEDYIEDLGSTNGTKVNGTSLFAHSPQMLANGDLIHIGSKTEIGYYK